MLEALKLAKEIVNDEPDEALRICNDVLNDHLDCDDGQMALFMVGYIMMQAERYGLAYQIYQRCAQLRPNMSEIWSNMGMCLEEKDPQKAKSFFKKAFKLDSKNYRALANHGLMCLQTGEPQKCIDLCNQSIKLKPDLTPAYHNRGLARIMLRDWGGWDDYYQTLGVKHREARDYGVPDWEGQEGTVLVYGEQGVGDEIMFASCLPDLLKTNRVILDCDSRLESLFKRSFDCTVFGDRFKTESRAADQKFNYQCAIGQLPYFYRRTEESFHGKPYLKPDPELCVQWRALFDTFKGKKVGIAWRGGLKGTGEAKRSLDIDDFAPLLDDANTHVSLEYKPVSDDIAEKYKLKRYRATEANGVIDDLAALVSQLDYVVSACTTVIYVAGSLGVPCYVLVPSKPGYRYHMEGDFPWYESVKLFRQKENEPWVKTVGRLAKQIEGGEC